MRIWLLMMLSAALGFAQANPANPANPVKPPDTLQRCQDILDTAIHDKNPDTRKSAAEALSLVGIKDNALEYLAPMLQDRDVTVRVAVLIALGDFKDPRTFPLLKRALRDPVPEVDYTAAKVLFQLHDPEGERFLLAVVGKETKASSNYFSKEKRTALRMLHTPTKLFTVIAVQAVGFVPVPGLGFGISSAQGILSDSDSSARAASLLLIGNSHDPELTDVVASSFTDKEWSVRAVGVHVAAMHPFPQFQQDLVPLLDDKKNAVRVRAAAAYIRLSHSTKPATPPAKRPSRVL